MIAYFILLIFVVAMNAKSEESKSPKQLPCDDLQRCLHAGSRACWKKFYDEGKTKDDLIADVLKVCPETDFMNFVEEAEMEMWPEFALVDKNLTDCMTDAGHRVYIDFCSNMRSSKFSNEMERTIEAAENSQKKKPSDTRAKRQSRRPTGDEGYKCWVTTLRNCADQYKLANDNVDKALEKCEKELDAVVIEERLGFEVGKRVMLKIVAK